MTETIKSLHDNLSQIDGESEVKVDGASAAFDFVADPIAQHRLLKDIIERVLAVRSFAQEKIDLHNAYLDTVKTRYCVGGLFNLFKKEAWSQVMA